MIINKISIINKIVSKKSKDSKFEFPELKNFPDWQNLNIKDIKKQKEKLFHPKSTNYEPLFIRLQKNKVNNFRSKSFDFRNFKKKILSISSKKTTKTLFDKFIDEIYSNDFDLKKFYKINKNKIVNNLNFEKKSIEYLTDLLKIKNNKYSKRDQIKRRAKSEPKNYKKTEMV